jgi:hypothetical protein
MALSAAQETICTDNSRFRVAVTGRRFGKTYCAMRELAKHAASVDQEVLYVAPSYRMAKSIAWENLKDKLKKLRWVEQTNEAELTIRLKSGSKIYLKGAENKDALRGNSYNLIVLDEFQDLDPELWTAVLRPALSDTKGKALFIGTPRGVGSFSHDMYTMAQTTEDWAAFSYKTIEGDQVDEEEIEQAKRDLDERTFEQEYLATFNTWSHSVFYNFQRQECVKDLKGMDKFDLHIGMDFNYSPMSAAIFVIHNATMYCVDEISIENSNTYEMVDEIKRRYPKSKITCYPDPAGRQRKSSAIAGATDISILQNAGFAVNVRPKHTPIRDRINAVNSKLKTVSGVRSLFVDKNCKQTIKSLESLSFKPNTSVVENNENTHMADAVGYCVDMLYPVKKDYEDKTTTQRWGFAGTTYGVK